MRLCGSVVAPLLPSAAKDQTQILSATFQYRGAAGSGRRECHSGSDKVGAFVELDRAVDLCARTSSTKPERDPLSVPGKRQA
jgi:hypothetical protein